MPDTRQTRRWEKTDEKATAATEKVQSDTERAAGNCDCSGEVRRSSDCLQNTVQQLGGRITETCISTLEERR